MTPADKTQKSRQRLADGSRSDSSVYARFDPTLRFRLYGTGPRTQYEDYATPEEAALALARANGKLMTCPLPRAFPVDPDSALLFRSESSPTGYAGVTFTDEIRKNKYKARLPRKAAKRRVGSAGSSATTLRLKLLLSRTRTRWPSHSYPEQRRRPTTPCRCPLASVDLPRSYSCTLYVIFLDEMYADALTKISNHAGYYRFVKFFFNLN